MNLCQQVKGITGDIMSPSSMNIHIKLCNKHTELTDTVKYIITIYTLVHTVILSHTLLFAHLHLYFFGHFITLTAQNVYATR